MKTVRECSFLLLSLAAIGCGGGGGGGAGQCVAAGGACVISAGCCSKNCDTKTGKCVGVDPTPDMAMTNNPNPDLSMMNNCSPLGGQCQKAADCCNGIPCNNNVCTNGPQLKKFGEACTMNTDCQTALCVADMNSGTGYCSAACARSADCTALSNNPAYWCLLAGGGSNYCFRDCTDSTECKDIGAAWSCRQSKSVDSLYKNVCTVAKSQPAGFPCLDNAQCAKNSCNSIWCADPCANDAACGQYAKCIFNNNQAYTCFPNCATDADCLIFGLGGGLTCQSTTSRDGATVKICSG